ncbi:MAG: type VI secretion system baseplate subunit TssF [Pyrinomonadaceae bacterium]
MRDELLDYYERELVFLRRMGADFAKKYPKVASRLLIDGEKVEDPHVERMIEAFSFLAARIRLKLNDELPEISESFLNVLYPHFLAPMPSMAITQFHSGSPKDKSTAIQKVARGAKLYSRTVDGSPCRFRSVFDVSLPPIEVMEAGLETLAPPNAMGRLTDAQIRIRMRCFGDALVSELQDSEDRKPLKALRFFINGDPQLVFPLYEIIFNHSVSVDVVPREAPLNFDAGQTISNVQLKLPDPYQMSADSIKQVGFEPHEAMIPYSKRSFAGYRLLSEYFAFPYKFLFFEIDGLEEMAKRGFGSHFDLVINLRDFEPPKAPINKEVFALGCTPIVNLFSKTSDPIYLTQQKYEYQVIPDVHRQTTTEIFSIDNVFATDPVTNDVRTFSPFYSTKHASGDGKDSTSKVFWYADRRQSQRENDAGTELFLNLVDLGFDPALPAEEVLTVKCTCTNRDLPARLPFGNKDGDFEIEGTAMVSRVRCLTKPTETIRPPRYKGAQWRLISHLNLNYLSIVESTDGKPEALREILELYNYSDSSAIHKQIMGITGIETKRVVRRIGRQIGAGFVRGIETTLEFDEDEFVGSGLFLFGAILDRFLAAYSSLNSFSQLVVRTEQKEEEMKRWAPRTGEQILL